ncbi:MAG: hypothetical protein K2R98_00930 [Gemmataceae bacterium]|nr:hypothetical protein [Gemmataceae bacterium]
MDFVHALTYLYVTATLLATSVAERWQWYVPWMMLVWQGRVGEVIADMETRLQRLEPIPAEGRLPLSRRGLPDSSSMGESLIKEINHRVKGTEKFWDNPEGAEAILQVRAALLNDDDRLAAHIENRPGATFRRHTARKHRQAA